MALVIFLLLRQPIMAFVVPALLFFSINGESVSHSHQWLSCLIITGSNFLWYKRPVWNVLKYSCLRFAYTSLLFCRLVCLLNWSARIVELRLVLVAVLIIPSFAKWGLQQLYLTTNHIHLLYLICTDACSLSWCLVSEFVLREVCWPVDFLIRLV